MEKVPKAGEEVKTFNDAKSKHYAAIISRLMFDGNKEHQALASSLFDGRMAVSKVLDRWQS